MSLTIHIDHVENLFVGGEGSGSPRASHRVAVPHEPARVEEARQHIGEIRARISAPKPCDMCHDTRFITWNPLGEVGDFRTEPCPKCRKERAA